MFEMTYGEESVVKRTWKWLARDMDERGCTWVLCWIDSGTIGEISSSRSVGMADLVELR